MIVITLNRRGQIFGQSVLRQCLPPLLICFPYTILLTSSPLSSSLHSMPLSSCVLHPMRNQISSQKGGIVHLWKFAKVSKFFTSFTVMISQFLRFISKLALLEIIIVFLQLSNWSTSHHIAEVYHPQITMRDLFTILPFPGWIPPSDNYQLPLHSSSW